MKLTFIGADHEVTGSCHFLEIGDKKLLVDCGMEQGRNLFENREIPANAGDIDYLLVTHAHIDHSGKIPLLVKRGFKGQIIATKATCDLCNIMLRDSAHIQEFEAKWRNRKAERSGKGHFEPMYDMNDVDSATKLFTPVDYDKVIKLDENISVRFTDVGHLLGSAAIEIFATEGEISRTLVFSGDIGNVNKPIVRDPKTPARADIVVMESTYGDRYHEPEPDYVGTLAAILNETFQRGGNVVIPSFAVGRTQELLFFLRMIKKDHLVTTYPDFEVFVDSPLSVEATNVFNENVEDCFDEETKALIDAGINPLKFPGLRVSVTSNDSIAINSDPKPKVIISASGMCDAGRIRHHLKYNLWRSDSTILFVGYQSEGTIGAALLNGAPVVKLFGEEILVKARIMKLPGTSGHADKKGLLHWLSSFESKPERVYVVHGDPDSCESFATCIHDEYGYHSFSPYSGTCVDLVTNEIIYLAEPVEAVKKSAATDHLAATNQTSGTTSHSKSNAGTVYGRLESAGERLLAVIKRNKGLANKDLAKFADAIIALCDKWDR